MPQEAKLHTQRSHFDAPSGVGVPQDTILPASLDASDGHVCIHDGRGVGQGRTHHLFWAHQKAASNLVVDGHVAAGRVEIPLQQVLSRPGFSKEVMKLGLDCSNLVSI